MVEQIDHGGSDTGKGNIALDHPVRFRRQNGCHRRHRQWRNYYRHESGDDDGFAACQQHHIQYGAKYDRSDQQGAKKVVRARNIIVASRPREAKMPRSNTLNACMSLDGGDPSFSRFIKRNGKTAPGHSLLARVIKRKLKTEQARALHQARPICPCKIQDIYT